MRALGDPETRMLMNTDFMPDLIPLGANAFPLCFRYASAVSISVPVQMLMRESCISALSDVLGQALTMMIYEILPV